MGETPEAQEYPQTATDALHDYGSYESPDLWVMEPAELAMLRYIASSGILLPVETVGIVEDDGDFFSVIKLRGIAITLPGEGPYYSAMYAEQSSQARQDLITDLTDALREYDEEKALV